MESEKSALLYERIGKVYCHSMFKSRDGVWFAMEPAYKMESLDDLDTIATAVRDCLHKSFMDAPHPTDFKTIFAIESLANLKTYNTFAKSAKCVKIFFKENKLILTPTKNGGNKEGFIPLHDKQLTVMLDEPELGKVVVAAIEHCQF